MLPKNQRLLFATRADACRLPPSSPPLPPLSIFTYRYFLHQWPQLCYLAYDGSDRPFGTVVCKMDEHGGHMRGYIAMLTVDKAHRGKRVGTRLVVCQMGAAA